MSHAWKLDAERWIRNLPPGTLFDASDLTNAVGHPDGLLGRNNGVGAVFGAMQKAGLIASTGQVRQSRAGHRKGGAVRIWQRLEDEQAALW